MYGERHYNAGVLMNGVAKLNALFAGKLSAKPIDDGFYSAPVTANHIVKSDEVFSSSMLQVDPTFMNVPSLPGSPLIGDDSNESAMGKTPQSLFQLVNQQPEQAQQPQVSPQPQPQPQQQQAAPAPPPPQPQPSPVPQPLQTPPVPQSQPQPQPQPPAVPLQLQLPQEALVFQDINNISIAKIGHVITPSSVCVLRPGALGNGVAKSEAVPFEAVKQLFMKHNTVLGSLALQTASIDSDMLYPDSATYYARVLFASRLQAFIEENAHIAWREPESLGCGANVTVLREEGKDRCVQECHNQIQKDHFRKYINEITAKQAVTSNDVPAALRPAIFSPCESVGCSAKTRNAIRNVDFCPALTPEVMCRCPPKHCFECETRLENASWVDQFMNTLNLHCCVECRDCGKMYCIHSLRKVTCAAATTAATTATAVTNEEAMASILRARQKAAVANLEIQRKRASEINCPMDPMITIGTVNNITTTTNTGTNTGTVTGVGSVRNSRPYKPRRTNYASPTVASPNAVEVVKFKPRDMELPRRSAPEQTPTRDQLCSYKGGPL